MEVISWDKLLERPDISLFYCEKCWSKTFIPIQTISLRGIGKQATNGQIIQYIKCTSCATVYAIIQ